MLTRDVATLAAQAQAALLRQDWPDAIASLRALLAFLNPPPAALQYNLGLALKRSGQHTEALPWIEKALVTEPAHQGAAFEKAAILMDIGRWQDALKAFEAYLARHPADEDAHRNHARLLEALGDWPAAAKAWKRLATGDPEARLAHLALAMEMGAPDAASLQRDLMRNPELRAELLKRITHAGQSQIPLRTRQLMT